MNNNINNEVKFTKWNKYSTEYGTLDVGTLEYTQSFSANLGLTGKSTATTSTKNTEKSGDNTSESSASFGPELSATANTSYSNSKKENQLIKQHYIQLTGSFEERKFCIHQQGTRETELAGNVSIDLTIKLPTKELLITSFSQLFNESGLPNPSDKINLNVIRYYVPDEDLLANGVNGIIKYDFVVRHIQKGANTFPEFDDKINFILGENSSNITLIKKEDLIVPTYFIKLSMKNNLPSLTYLESGKNIVIQFINYEDAFEFKNWLINKIHSLDNDLTITGRIISFNGLKLSDNSVKENLTKIEIDIYKPQ
jgi:hypothetical protein